MMANLPGAPESRCLMAKIWKGYSGRTGRRARNQCVYFRLYPPFVRHDQLHPQIFFGKSVSERSAEAVYRKQ
jgi:hypothetical protein